MTLTDPLEALHQAASKFPTQRKAAAYFGISQAYLSDMLNGRRNITDTMLTKLGLCRVVMPMQKRAK